MTSKEKSYEGWAIIELFGHNMIAGLLSEQTVGGTPFVRVDVPATDEASGFTKFFGGAAIYAITPTTEELATQASKNLAIRPVTPWIVSPPNGQQQLPSVTVNGDSLMVDGEPVPF